jgi:hypothetical protein
MSASFSTFKARSAQRQHFARCTADQLEARREFGLPGRWRLVTPAADVRSTIKGDENEGSDLT